MKRTSNLVGLAALALVLASSAYASPLVGVSANTLPQGTFMMDTWGIWRDYQRAYDEGLYDQDDGGWISLPDDYRLTSASLVPRLYYGVTDWLTIRLAVPLEDRFTEVPESSVEDSNTGLGDIVLDPKVQIFRGEGGYPRVALLGGVRFPTGDSGGNLPLSDGSTDALAGFVVTHEMGRVMGHACVTYWFNGDNEDGNDVKDCWIGSATIESSVAPNWSLLWELKGYIGETPSEFYRVYACPGVSWDNGEHLTVGVSALVSIVSTGGGGISWVDYDWAPYFRVYYRFF